MADDDFQRKNLQGPPPPDEREAQGAVAKSPGVDGHLPTQDAQRQERDLFARPEGVPADAQAAFTKETPFGRPRRPLQADFTTETGTVRPFPPRPAAEDDVETFASIVVRHGDRPAIEVVPGDLSKSTGPYLAQQPGEPFEAFAARVAGTVREEIAKARRVQFAGSLSAELMEAFVAEALDRSTSPAAFFEEVLQVGLAVLQMRDGELPPEGRRVIGPWQYLLLIRGIQRACSRCGGSGWYTYASTATYHGGPGGSMLTSDVCNRCWGSGDANRPWPARSDR